MIRNHHSNSHMPRTSTRQELLHVVDQAAYALAQSKYWNAVQDHEDSSSDFDTNFDTDDMDITPPSPLTPNLSSQFSNGSDDSDDDSDDITACYDRLQDTITALRDEVERARVLHKPNEPPPRAPQLHILVHHEEHRPHLFRQKLRVDPLIFDDILDQISDHHIFHNRSNNPQLPISIQLAIFLNRAGHYGNVISVQDVAQWAGISVGSVVNSSCDGRTT